MKVKPWRTGQILRSKSIKTKKYVNILANSLAWYVSNGNAEIADPGLWCSTGEKKDTKGYMEYNYSGKEEVMRW